MKFEPQGRAARHKKAKLGFPWIWWVLFFFSYSSIGKTIIDKKYGIKFQRSMSYQPYPDKPVGFLHHVFRFLWSLGDMQLILASNCTVQDPPVVTVCTRLVFWRPGEIAKCKSLVEASSTYIVPFLKICFLRKLDLDDDWYHIKWRFKSPGIVQRFSGCRNERSLLVNPQFFLWSFVRPTFTQDVCSWLSDFSKKQHSCWKLELHILITYHGKHMKAQQATNRT